jgi:hypothetical protein
MTSGCRLNIESQTVGKSAPSRAAEAHLSASSLDVSLISHPPGQPAPAGIIGRYARKERRRVDPDQHGHSHAGLSRPAGAVFDGEVGAIAVGDAVWTDL